MKGSRFSIREGRAADLAFLLMADLRSDREDDGGKPDHIVAGETPFETRRVFIRKFIEQGDKAAWLAVSDSGEPVGTILCRFRDRQREGEDQFTQGTALGLLDPAILPADGRFCEVYQLWVEPEFRRLGIATRLKQHLEDEAHMRGIRMIYTHTRLRNAHVIELNHRLGYKEVRRGPIWDEVARVSLVKILD